MDFNFFFLKKTQHFSVTSSGCTASVFSGDANPLILLLGNAKGKTTGHWKITWFVWSYRKKLVLNSDSLRPSSVPGLSTYRTTTGKSLRLTELQLPSCEARIRRALFTQALVWLSCADCKPCGAQTLALPEYAEELFFFLNNHQMHRVNPWAPKT